MSTFGNRPDDVVQDRQGNAQSGVLISLYPTSTDATNQTNLLTSATSDTDGRWPVTLSGYDTVWARDPKGNTWPVDAGDALTNVSYRTPKTYVSAGSGDQTTALQAFLDGLSNGDDALITGTVNFTSLTVTKNNVRIRLAPGANLNKTDAFSDGLNVSGSGVIIEGGTITCPSSWDGTNAQPTYAVIHGTSTALGLRVRNITLTNVPKVGVYLHDLDDAMITGCTIVGNYPAGSYTGVETGHFGICWNPATTGLAPVITGNQISTCVQGVFYGNYGAGSGNGAVTSNNRFYGCHNHGVYISGGVNTCQVTDNVFLFCQVPVAATGSGHRISQNTLWTTSTGNGRDQVGISVRDCSDVQVIGNTITGDNTNSNVAIDVTSIGTSTIERVLVKDNVINMVGSSSGLPAIRLGSSAVTLTLNDCIVDGNTIKSAGQSGQGVITVAAASGGLASRCAVTNNIVRIIGNSHGIYINRGIYCRVTNNTIVTEYDAGSATTLIRVQLGLTTDTVVFHNTYVNTAAFGTNVTLHGTRELDSTCDRNTLGPNFIRDDLTKAASSTEVVQANAGNSSLVGISSGDYATATALGTLSGKVEVRDSKGTVKGYFPVYTTIT